MSEPNRAVQEEELEALRAIFEDDWHDIPPKKTAWGTESEGGWWEIILRAEDDRVKVSLRGRMIKQYPLQAPPLQLLEPKGLTPQHVNDLGRLLQDRAKASVGAPMIFDLADMAREWITNNHIPIPKPGERVPNLMEEMAKREEVQRALEAAQSQAQQEQQIAEVAEQNRLLTEKIQIDASRKENRARQVILDEVERCRQESLATLADGELEMRELLLDEPVSVDGFDGSWRAWVLFSGRSDTLWTIYTAEPDPGGSGFVKASLPSVTVQVIDFSKAYYSTTHGKKRIDAIAVEALRLREVLSDNVVRILAVKRDKSPKGWERLIIVVERVPGVNTLRKWTSATGLGELVAREYISQVLAGLIEIHRIGATQKQLDLDSVFVVQQAFDSNTLRLSGTGYARRLVDLHRSNPFLRSYEETTPESWLSPDEIDSPHSYSAKRDIWHVGLLLIQLLFGPQALYRFPNLPVLVQNVPSTSDATMDLLNGLLHPNFKKRLSAEEALNQLKVEEDVTRRVPRGFSGNSWPSGVPITSPTDLLETSAGNRMSTYFSMPQPNAPRLSRYRTDFEEVEFLGKGGFGEVVKARNKLDGRSYAIKKVKLRPEDNEQKVYREVNSLSRVSHQYIVRYYGCWLEDLSRPEPQPEEASTPVAAAQVSSEEDIFATNFDDLSLSRQSRSASFPRIRFANSDGDEDEDEESDSDSSESTSDSSDDTAADPSEHRGRHMVVPPKPSLSLTGTTEDDSSVQRILYIQMEFVEKQTLREAITTGLSDDEVWRLLVQILQALAHMSTLGIVHRDLKPSNILLDANGNVKIADFGLSTTELTRMESAIPSDTSGDIDRTSNIGTSLYIAPEVAISRTYNEKADMYSLGIIFFEMSYPFKTAMERAHILNAVRTPAIAFPPGWPMGVKPNQREIVTWLLRHDPMMRPLATQLLASPLLPSPEKQKEYYDTAIAELTNPKSSQYPVLLEALFGVPSIANSTLSDNRLDDYTYDNDHDDELQVWLNVVIQRLGDLFQRHGAVEAYLPLFIPETTLLTAFPDLTPVRLLDQNGKVVQLPSSYLLAMARSATRRQIERIKRFHVGRRYADHPAGGQPAVSGELTFDIVSPLRSAAAEAELLDAVDKVVSEFRGGRGSASTEFEFHISHETVLSTILAAVPEKGRTAVLKTFKSLNTGAAGPSRSTLGGITGISKQLVDDIESCCNPGEFEAMRGKLETTFTSSRRKLTAALDEMAAIIQLARSCGIGRRILFRPTLSRNAEFFRGGFMFECVRRGKQREVVAFGGRYDSLLEHFKEPAQQMQSRRVFGVGMSIAIDQLARMVRKYESSLSTRLMTKENEDERSFGFWSPARCDVYVASVAQVDLAVRLSVTGELWRAGIRADLQYDDDRSLEEVLVECLEQNILYLVIPRANRPVLKVRSILKRSEEEVPRNDLTTYLRQAITEQRRIDASYASAEGSIPSSQSAASALSLSVAGNNNEPDIRLVLPPEPMDRKYGGTKVKGTRKHRYVTKSVYYDKAAEFAQSSRSSLPVYGVDLPLPLLSSLALDASWVNEDEPWRQVLSSAGISTGDRKYVEIVREAVRAGQSPTHSSLGNHVTGDGGGNGWVWLFSVREGRGFLLQLGK